MTPAQADIAAISDWLTASSRMRRTSLGKDRILVGPYGTEAKARDKVASDPVIAVLHEMAERGVCPHDRKAAGIISNKTLTALVHQAGGRNMFPEEIANKLLDLVPHAEKTRKAMFLERTHAYTDMNGDASVTPIIETRQRG